MEQIVCVVLGRPELVSGATPVWRWTAGAMIMATAVLICLMLSASQA